MLPRSITRQHLDTMFQFKVVEESYGSRGQLQPGDLVIRAPLSITDADGPFRIIQYQPKTTIETENANVIFPTPTNPSNHSAGPASHRVADLNADDDSHLDVADDELRRSIIAEWEQLMSSRSLAEFVCAVCGRRTPTDKVVTVEPSRIDLTLLRNDELPGNVLPTTYNLDAYDRAILHPKGLTKLREQGTLRICVECSRPLFDGVMPRFALANWLYYGHEELPSDVKTAFRLATHVERILVSRARGSRISYKFSQLPGHYLEGTDSRVSQSCVKGNVAIHPQDATHLNDVLPPVDDTIRDTVCAVFVGETKPTRETIAKLKPVLVRKSRVKCIIQFLVAHNPWYSVSTDFKGFSQENLDQLLGRDAVEVDEGVLCSMEIGHIQHSNAVTGATDGYVPGDDGALQSSSDGMLMENVGYTDDSESPVDYNGMSLRALAHCLKGGAFIKSQAGSKLIPDFENPRLLSWLFPHLDPWGIGGFYDARRRLPLSLDQQLKYLLMVDDSPFRDDPDFAFVYYNIRQKRAVFDSITFRVAASQREYVTEQLLKVDITRLEKLIAAFKSNPKHEVRDPDDAAILKLLLKVNTVTHDLPGSNGYKVMLRNQIRALTNFVGTPTLFITLNPSDRDHPLVRLYAGHDIDVESEARGEELSRWKRTMLAAANPSACARFFDRMITQFIEVVLRFKSPKRGLFG
ncbi:hypothetical protein FKP32DRAFT_1567353, partial [Trametes sanguinea]